jgi:hypothetical protein
MERLRARRYREAHERLALGLDPRIVLAIMEMDEAKDEAGYLPKVQLAAMPLAPVEPAPPVLH